MSVEHIILAVVLILGLSLIAQPVSRWLHMPYASILVVLGFIASELVVYAGIDTGLRADNFQSIIFYIFIPVLVFESAYNIDKQMLKNNLVVILSLAVIAMLLTCFITAVLLFYGIAHESGFPWLAALITGAILAATDPVAVIIKLREINAPARVSVLLEGESLFNDATAIVLFGLFLSLATATGTIPEVGLQPTLVIIKSFIYIFVGGAVVGLLFGLFFGFLQQRVDQDLLTGVMGLLVAYGSYLLAEYFGVSGVMSTLLAALSFSAISKDDKDAGERNKYFWDMLSHVANVSVFLVMGAVITIEMFEYRWLAMLIAIFSLLIARLISVYGVLIFFTVFKSLKVPISALSLPTSLDYWWTIQSIAFGVVMFSLFVQAPTMQLLVKRLSV
jgi:CPA1 family monovalent cation:H+ antiporter